MPSKGATHFELIMEGAALSFGADKAAAVSGSTGWLRLDADHGAQVLQGSFSGSAGQRMVMGAGIRFGVETNGAVAPLLDKTACGFVVGGFM